MVNKIKKEKDGNYYEKQVTWKRNKESNSFTFGSLVCLSIIVGYMIRDQAIEPNFLGILCALGGLALSFFIINIFIIYDRKVILRKLK